MPKIAIARVVMLVGLPWFAGCSSLPSFLGGEPRAIELRARKHYERARRLASADAYESALEELDQAIAREPRYVQAHRLQQEIEIARYRKAGLLRTWDARLGLEPHVPEWHYLRGRLEGAVERQERYFERALELDPTFPWAHYGLGVLAAIAGRDGEAERHFEIALANAPGTVEMVLGKAQVLVRRAAFDEARALIESARREDADEVRYPLALVAIEVERQSFDEAWADALEALRTDPRNTSAYEVLTTFVRERGEHVVPTELEDRLVEVAEVLRADARTEPLVIARWQRLAGDSARLTGQWESAVLRYGRALQSGAHPFEVADGLRIALVHAGRYDEALKTFLETLPANLLEHEANRLRARFVELEHATALAERETSGASLVALSQAYRAVGFLDEAVVCAARAELLAESSSPEALGLRLEVQRFERFLRSTRRRILEGYRDGNSPAFEPIVREVERVGSLILGEDVGESHIENLAFFAERVDPVTYDRGVPRFFAHFGRFAMLGRLFQSPVEFYTMRQMHARAVEGRILGRPYGGVTVIGESREIPARAELLGGGVAGAAVYEGYFLNLDVVRAWCIDLLRVLARLPESSRAAWLMEDLPACEPEERTSLDEPLHVAERLFLRSIERDGELRDDLDLLARLLEVVAVHERAHLADAFEFLPIGRNLLRMFVMLVEEGFSAFAVQSRLEMRAELATLAASEASDLVLAHIVSYLETNATSAHGRGFSTILERFVAELDEHLEEYPSLRGDRVLVQQLHLLTRDEIRKIARVLAEREGLIDEP